MPVTKCARRPYPLAGKGAAKGIDIKIGGGGEGEDSITVIYEISLSPEKTLLGYHFWAKGYCVDTVGVNAEIIREYVKYQEKQEQR